MPDFLVVRLPAEPGNVSWVTLDAAGQRLTAVGQGTLEAAVGAAEHCRVMLLVSGFDVVCTRASLPVKGSARLRQMLPYSLEDAVADDVDRLHFAAGARDASGEMPVAVVARRKLDRWREDCEQAGLAPERVYAESEGVPATPGCLTLVVENTGTYGRAPGQAPFALQGLTLSEVLEVVVHGNVEGQSEPLHVVLYADEAGYARCEDELAWLREQNLSVDVQLLRDGILPRLGTTLIDQPGSNLLQGIYGPKTDLRTRFRPWRMAAALLIGLVSLTMLGEGVRYLSLSRQDRTLTTMLRAACERNVQSAALSSCEAEVRRLLASTSEGTGSEFLLVLDAVTRAWDETARIEALSYRNGVMDLRMTSTSVSALDELTRKVNSQGSFQASILSANPSEDGVLGRLQVVGSPL